MANFKETAGKWTDERFHKSRIDFIVDMNNKKLPQLFKKSCKSIFSQIN